MGLSDDELVCCLAPATRTNRWPWHGLAIYSPFRLLVIASVLPGPFDSLKCSHLIFKNRGPHWAAIFAFLAVKSDLQDEFVAQVQEVSRGRDDDTLVNVILRNALLPGLRTPRNTFLSWWQITGKLDEGLAAFYEGTRMFRR